MTFIIACGMYLADVVSAWLSELSCSVQRSSDITCDFILPSAILVCPYIDQMNFHVIFDSVIIIFRLAMFGFSL